MYYQIEFHRCHTYAKLIEIQKNYLQKIHALHELGSHMECNDTLHGSELGPHWVLGPKIQNLVQRDKKILLENFFTQSQLGTMWLFCWVLKPKWFFGLNRLAIYRFQILHYQLDKKNEIDFAALKSSLCKRIG